MGLLHSWQRLWRREARPVQAPQARLSLERLEDRTVPATYFVSPAGADVAGGGGTANPFHSIQYAVNRAATTGDSIAVAAGTYTYSAAADLTAAKLGTSAVVVVYNKQLIIRGGYDAANWVAAPDANVNPTYIDGQGGRRGVLVVGVDPKQTNAAIDLENVTVQNGLAQSIPSRGGDDALFGFGGGVFIDLGSQQNAPVAQVFHNVTFRYNAALGTTVSSGTGAGGGGEGGGMALRFANNVFLDTVTFLGNHAGGGNGSVRGGQGVGGGLQASNSRILSAINVIFSSNAATGGTGGGDGVTPDGERADGLGGAAALQDGSSLSLFNSSVTGNVALGGNSGNQAGGGYGGGFEVESSSLSVVNSTISNNTAQGGVGRNEAVLQNGNLLMPQGGGAAGGGGVMTFNGDVALNRVSVIGNAARGGPSLNSDTTGFYGPPSGGGLYLAHFDTATHVASITNSVIADNRIEFATELHKQDRPESFTNGGGGAALWIQGTPTQILHTTIANNVLGANLFYGSAILMYAGNTQPNTTTAAISYTLIANQTNTLTNGALQVWGGSTATLTRVLFANDTQPTSVVGPNQTPGTITGFDASLVAANAFFVSAGAPNEDYHILGNSPAKNQATGSSATVDRDNLARDASPDIGAFEVQPTRIQFAAAHYDTFENAATVAVTLTRTGDASGASTVSLATGGGTAGSGDYTAIPPTVITFNAGDTTKVVTITLHDDTTAEPAIETFNVTLSSPTGAALGARTATTVNLVDNEVSDLANFINGTLHTLENSTLDATGFIDDYNSLAPGFTAALSADATIFLTSKEYYSRLVQSAYVTFLGRTPGAGETDVWASRAQATSVEEMLAEIISSPEGISHNGGTPTAWLNAASQGLLSHAADPTFLTTYLATLNLGQPGTFLSAARQIAQSPEYRTKLVNDFFQTFLNRAPAASEQANVDSLVNLLATQPRQAVASQLLSSPEYFSAAGNTVGAWVGSLFTKLLARTADAGGLAVHQGAVLNVFAASRSAFVNSVLGSVAYRTSLIQSTFTQLLGHSPSAGQLSQWLNLLAGGWTLAQFKAVLLGSPEYFQTQASNNASAWLNQLYLIALGHPINGPATNLWMGQLNSGVSRQAVASAILGSPEALDKRTTDGYVQILGRSASAVELGIWRPAWIAGMRDEAFFGLLLASAEYFGTPHQTV